MLAVHAVRAMKQIVERQLEQRFDLGYAPARGAPAGRLHRPAVSGFGSSFVKRRWRHGRPWQHVAEKVNIFSNLNLCGTGGSCQTIGALFLNKCLSAARRLLAQSCVLCGAGSGGDPICAPCDAELPRLAGRPLRDLRPAAHERCGVRRLPRQPAALRARRARRSRTGFRSTP